MNREGARVGKGGGYSDLEFALLAEAGLVGSATMATTAHPLQVLDEDLPETDHDFNHPSKGRALLGRFGPSGALAATAALSRRGAPRHAPSSRRAR